MNKERLYYEMPDDDYRKMLDFFFDSNVVIPRGENRHRDADVIHAYAEGIECQYRVKGGEWVIWAESIYEYRIKPKEPVCEYLWLDLRTPDDFYCPTNKYMTELEAEAYFRPSHTWFKVLETKRERK